MLLSCECFPNTAARLDGATHLAAPDNLATAKLGNWQEQKYPGPGHEPHPSKQVVFVTNKAWKSLGLVT